MMRSSPTWRKRTEQNSLYLAGARGYERHADTSIYNARYERPAMLAVIGDPAGLRVLDAGCGPGYYASVLASSAKEIVAIDASDAMIALVDKKDLSNVHARVHDLSAPLEFVASGSVDLILSSLTMHYLPTWTNTLAEFRRVLRAGGRLVVSTHHPAMTAPLVENYFETQLVTDTWAINGVDTDVHFYHRPMNAIVNAFINAGFTHSRLIEPQLSARPDSTEAERRLSTRPWFLIIEAQA